MLESWFPANGLCLINLIKYEVQEMRVKGGAVELQRQEALKDRDT